jgi:type III restriction enzyme
LQRFLKKNIEELDIVIPELTPRIYREYKNFSDLNPATFAFKKLPVKQFSEEEKRQIVFKDITDDTVSHTTELPTAAAVSGSNVVGFFARMIKNDLHLVGGYDVLYEKVKEFVRDHLFMESVEVDDLNTLRNLSEIEATRTIYEVFKREINALTVRDRGEAEIRNHIKLSACRPFVVKNQEFLVPRKSIFNKIVGDSHFELEFAAFLEDCDDIVSYGRNYFGLNFALDYQDADGDIRKYYPDFFVKQDKSTIFIVETKGCEDLDDLEKIKRLRLWCEDVNALQSGIHYECVYVKQETYEKYRPKSFSDLLQLAES